MGCVWLARTDDGRKAAVKQLNNQYVTDSRLREYFMREAQAMRQLNHPNVVKLVGQPYADTAGNLYMPMEFVEGDTIEHIVQRQGHYSPEQAIRLMIAILDTFVYVHSKGMVHRDIKPSNIMVRPDGSVCVIDFGIAKDMKTSTGQTIGNRVGTDGYMSPEQVSATTIDHRTDIYSLGCLLHYMLTGRHPFLKKQNSYETSISILNDAFPSAQALVPDISDTLQAVLYKATDKNMLLRYQSAAEFRRALANLLPDNLNAYEITVGRKGCDINIANDYVSSHHLTIRFMPPDQMEIHDHSRNGTGVNGRYVKHDVCRFTYDPHGTTTQPQPQILLAGRAECELPWNEVTRRLQRNKGSQVDRVVNEPEPPKADTLPPPLTKESSDGWAYVVLVLFFPVIGIILWIMKKSQFSDEANKRIGISVIVTICLRVISNAIILLN